MVLLQMEDKILNGSTVRTLGLIAMLIFYAPLLVTLWLMEQYFFFWTFVGIGLTVGIGEIVAYIITGKTLSTNFTRKMRESSKYFWAGVGALSALLASIVSLIVHLLPWK